MLGLRHDRWGSAVARVAARGGNGGVRRIVVVLFVAGGSQGPQDFLHFGRPDVLSGFTSLDGGHSEGNDVYKNYEGFRSARPMQSGFSLELTDQQVQETKHSDCQDNCTGCNGLLGSVCQGRSRGAHTTICVIS